MDSQLDYFLRGGSRRVRDGGPPSSRSGGSAGFGAGPRRKIGPEPLPPRLAAARPRNMVCAAIAVAGEVAAVLTAIDASPAPPPTRAPVNAPLAPPNAAPMRVPSRVVISIVSPGSWAGMLTSERGSRCRWSTKSVRESTTTGTDGGDESVCFRATAAGRAGDNVVACWRASADAGAGAAEICGSGHRRAS